MVWEVIFKIIIKKKVLHEISKSDQRLLLPINQQVPLRETTWVGASSCPASSKSQDKVGITPLQYADLDIHRIPEHFVDGVFGICIVGAKGHILCSSRKTDKVKLSMPNESSCEKNDTHTYLPHSPWKYKIRCPAWAPHAMVHKLQLDMVEEPLQPQQPKLQLWCQHIDNGKASWYKEKGLNQ